MTEVKTAHLIVTVAGAFGEIHATRSGPEDKRWIMGITTVVISYTYDRLVGYWRVEQSAVSGKTMGHNKAPNVYTFPFGDSSKPMWLVALEHKHYPASRP